MSATIHQQLHGYRSGHQLLQSSVRLDRQDQDLIDHLSDMAGPLRPGETFDPYVTAYPLPSLKFYALARTEQDLNVPRAGCVTTKTLLVPMHYWKNEGSPAALAELLKGPTSDEPIAAPNKLRAPALAPVNNPELAELVEALFLEERSAIVVFEALSPKEIALRLLTAIWPGMRRNFSLCTYALSPRRLSGKSFDLLFAPESARSRFSDWEGRRIETSGNVVGARHRWTSRIVHRMFYSPIPHLLDADSGRAWVADDDEGNESVLRLSLLWDELREKAIESPTAVLGMIDIANSRDAVASTWEVLEPAIATAVTNAAESMDTRSAWKFFTALLGKFETEPLASIVSKSLRSAGTKLTQRDWGSALTYLAGEASIEKGNNRELLQSIANSLATVDPHQLTGALVAVSPERLLKIALLDDGFCARIFSATDAGIDAALIQSLTQGFQSLTPEERNGHRFLFLPHIRGDQDSALLAQIIKNAPTTQLTETVELIWSANTRRTPQLGKVLCRAATAAGARREVRAAFVRFGDDVQTNRCIERLLAVDLIDIRWLLENAELRNRRTVFLNNLIEGSNPDDLEQAFSSARIATKALKLLTMDPKQFAVAAARVVMVANIAAADHITLGLKIYPILQGDERAMLAQSLISRVLTDATVHEGDLPERAMAAVLNDIDLPAAITIGLDPDQDGRQISRTLVAFDRTAPAVRTLVEAHVDLVVRLVTSRHDFDLTVEGAMALARLIETSVQLDRHTYEKICSTILPFAMAAPQKPASPIILAAFPTVYDRLRKTRGDFGLVELFKFVDWDKCKTARKDLVRAFMTSEWPPVDLTIVANRTGELSRILKRLLKEPGGTSYLAKIEEGTQRLQEVIREPVLKAIKEVRNAGRFIRDSET